MLAVACTNSVIGKGIMTYCPPTAVPKLLSNPLTKEVRGRGVKESHECACIVMQSVMMCPKKISDFRSNHFVLLRKKSEIPNVFIDLTDVENEGHVGVDDEHQVHINTYDGDDGLLDDPQANDDTNNESSHDGLLDNPQTNSDTNDEGSHDGLLDNLQTNGDENDESSHDKLLADPQTNGVTNDEGVREGCNVADGQPLLNIAFMNFERLILCLAKNENTYVYKELPEGKKNNCFFIIDNTDISEKRKRGDKSVFWDDRGAWTNGVTNKSLFIRKEDEPMRKVVVKNGVYHYEKQQCKKKIRDCTTDYPAKCSRRACPTQILCKTHR
ncbi:hypothetical protein PoB_000555800 [Plakobranchus ocellatus]|uniref:Uncharacterized protein n=1 Tax=Plakobranchus ocellatus TaxID=259542 RepID=A0AAV3Y962_9GAST|nr:hypothetical protein PoB_000555800 [Plakobranchus ocellatus]